MAGDTKETGPADVDAGVDANDPLAPLTSATSKGFDVLAALIGMVDFEIIKLDVNAAARTSQYPKLRVYYVIVNPITAAEIVLNIGSVPYAFDGGARSLSTIPFPLVIERGTDMFATGTDGRIYLIGKTE